MKYRLKDMFGLVEKQDYANRAAGTPEGKKGSDWGIDGVINFLNEKNKTERILVQVKSRHVKAGDIRDLRGVVEREGAAMGVLLSLEEPTRDMLTEAVSAGWYHAALWQKDYALIHILTIADIFAGKGMPLRARSGYFVVQVDLPPSAYGTFKPAEKIKMKEATHWINSCFPPLPVV